MTPDPRHDLPAALHARVLALRAALAELLARCERVNGSAKAGDILMFPEEMLERARKALETDP